MEVSVCGPRGQLVVRRVGLVPSLGLEAAIAQSLTTMGKTALETTVRQSVVKLPPVQVRKTSHYVFYVHSVDYFSWFTWIKKKDR